MPLTFSLVHFPGLFLHANDFYNVPLVPHRAKDSVKHFHVTRREGDGYVFGFNKFATLQDFVYHFANQPLLGSDAGKQSHQHGHYKCRIVSRWLHSKLWTWPGFRFLLFSHRETINHILHSDEWCVSAAQVRTESRTMVALNSSLFKHTCPSCYWLLKTCV